DDLLRGGAGGEDPGDAGPGEGRQVLVGDDAAAEDQLVAAAALAQLLDHGGTHALQGRAGRGPVPLALHAPDAVGLPLLDLERDAQEVGRPLLGHLVAVHAHHGLLAAVDLLLVGVGGVGDLALRVAGIDRLHHAAEAVDAVDVLPSIALHAVRQRLDRPAPAERV